VVLAAAALGLATGVVGLGWLRGRRGPADPLRRELDRLLRICGRRGMAPTPGETLPAFTARLAKRWPPLAAELLGFVALYQRQRFTPEALPGEGLAEKQVRRASGQGLRMLRRQRKRLGRRLQRLPP
jgi:hypothetical protein